MAKSDLRARRIFHSTRESIEAYLTIVFAALAVSRHLQAQTGTSIKKFVRALRPLRTAQIRLAGQAIIATPMITPEALEILDHLPPITAPARGTQPVKVRTTTDPAALDTSRPTGPTAVARSSNRSTPT